MSTTLGINPRLYYIVDLTTGTIRQVAAGTRGAVLGSQLLKQVTPASTVKQVPGIGAGVGGLTGVGGLGADLNVAGINAGGSNQILPGVTAPNVSSILGFITDLSNWQRLGEAILGIALLLLGLKAMTGGSGDPVSLLRGKL